MGRRPPRVHPLAALIACWACAAGCIENVENAVSFPDLDPAFHRCEVEPVFDHSCSALACHGDAQRPFHVFTRNRLRLVGTNTDRNQLLTDEEISANFDNARGFAADPPEDSWLLRKPLEQAAGGYFHVGKERFGGEDVWTTRDDADYQVVLAWLRGATADPQCIAPGSF